MVGTSDSSLFPPKKTVELPAIPIGSVVLMDTAAQR